MMRDKIRNVLDGAPSGLLRVLGLLVAATLVAGAAPGIASGAAATAEVRHTPGHPTRYLDPTYKVRTDADLVYGRVLHDDGTRERLRLDLFRPVGDTRARRPVVIYIHGGDNSSDKSLPRNRDVAKGFARRGFVAASINYRDGTSGISAESQDDTRAAVRWFRANATRFGISTKRISLMGSSAGAINALQVAFAPEDPGSSGHPGYSSRVSTAIAVSGTDYEVLEIGPDEVPIAMVHALDDTTVPYAAAQATCEQTQGFGNVCRFFTYEEGGHPPTFLTQNRRQITEQASGFICRHVLVGAACHAGGS